MPDRDRGKEAVALARSFNESIHHEERKYLAGMMDQLWPDVRCSYSSHMIPGGGLLIHFRSDIVSLKNISFALRTTAYYIESVDVYGNATVIKPSSKAGPIERPTREWGDAKTGVVLPIRSFWRRLIS